MAISLQLLFTILSLCAMYALTTVGFTLIYAVAKVLHVAQGVVTLLGAYLFLTTVNAGGNLVAAGTAAVAGCALVGWLMNAAVFERLRRQGQASSVGALIASLALLVMGSNALQLLFGPQTQTMRRFVWLPRWTIGGASFGAADVAAVATAGLILGAAGWWLRAAKLGRALRAVADNTTVAEVVGINSRAMRHLAFGLGSALAGMAGCLYALKFGLEPNQSVLIGVKVFARAVVGGVGSIPGAIIGNAIIEVTENLGAFFTTNAFKELFSFAVVFIFLLILPHGIFGRRRAKTSYGP